MRSLYVYYRVLPTQCTPLWQAVTDMQLRLRSAMPGLAASLHQRLDSASDQPATWMETYHFNGHASDQAWQAFEAALGAQALLLPLGIDGARHLERFVRMDTAPPQR